MTQVVARVAGTKVLDLAIYRAEELPPDAVILSSDGPLVEGCFYPYARARSDAPFRPLRMVLYGRRGDDLRYVRAGRGALPEGFMEYPQGVRLMDDAVLHG